MEALRGIARSEFEKSEFNDLCRGDESARFDDEEDDAVVATSRVHTHDLAGAHRNVPGHRDHKRHAWAMAE